MLHFSLLYCKWWLHSEDKRGHLCCYADCKPSDVGHVCSRLHQRETLWHKSDKRETDKPWQDEGRVRLCPLLWLCEVFGHNGQTVWGISTERKQTQWSSVLEEQRHSNGTGPRPNLSPKLQSQASIKSSVNSDWLEAFFFRGIYSQWKGCFQESDKSWCRYHHCKSIPRDKESNTLSFLSNLLRYYTLHRKCYWARYLCRNVSIFIVL